MQKKFLLGVLFLSCLNIQPSVGPHTPVTSQNHHFQVFPNYSTIDQENQRAPDTQPKYPSTNPANVGRLKKRYDFLLANPPLQVPPPFVTIHSHNASAQDIQMINRAIRLSPGGDIDQYGDSGSDSDSDDILDLQEPEVTVAFDTLFNDYANETHRLYDAFVAQEEFKRKLEQESNRPFNDYANRISQMYEAEDRKNLKKIWLTQKLPGKRKQKESAAHALAKELTNKEFQALTSKDLTELSERIVYLKNMQPERYQAEDAFHTLECIIASKLGRNR